MTGEDAIKRLQLFLVVDDNHSALDFGGSGSKQVWMQSHMVADALGDFKNPTHFGLLLGFGALELTIQERESMVRVGGSVPYLYKTIDWIRNLSKGRLFFTALGSLLLSLQEN